MGGGNGEKQLKSVKRFRANQRTFHLKAVFPWVCSFRLKLTLSASSSSSQPKGKLLQKRGKYTVAGQSTSLLQILQRRLQQKTLEKWRVKISLEICLKRCINTTQTPLETSHRTCPCVLKWLSLYRSGARRWSINPKAKAVWFDKKSRHAKAMR